MFRFFLQILAFLGICWLATESHSESLGELSVNQILLKPSFELNEPSQGAFDLGESSFSVLWTKQGGFSAQVRIGSVGLLSVPHYVSSQPPSDLGLYEAYAKFEGVYGDLMMGLIPLNYSIEGGLQETELLMPRSILFRQRIVGLRDYGFSLYTEFSNFFTRLVIHNGEGGKALDQNTWVTMQWGGGDKHFFKWMISAQTGDSDAVSMSSSQTVVASVDRTQLAHWRIGGFSIRWHPHDWNMLLEAHYGELLQNEISKRYASAHFDLSYRWNSWFQTLFRWDEFDPDGSVVGDLQQEVSMGFSINGEHSNSVFSVIATQVTEESLEVNNNRLLFQWKLTPVAP